MSQVTEAIERVALRDLGDGVTRDMSGEDVLGFRVAAYRETHPEHGDTFGHRYSEHWSTPSTRDPRVKVERLFTEEQLRAAMSSASPPVEQSEGVDAHGLKWALVRAYAQGATDAHTNYEEDRDPDFKEAGCDYADSVDIAALTPPPVTDLLAELEKHSNWELTCGPVDGDLSESAWQVNSVNGGINDREWTLVGVGITPADAIRAALKEGHSLSTVSAPK